MVMAWNSMQPMLSACPSKKGVYILGMQSMTQGQILNWLG